MDDSEIMNLLKYGEHMHLECKKAEAKLPQSVWETYSSFANTDGGVILFGVEEHLRETKLDRRFSFVSINNPEQRIKDFWNTINSDKVSNNILIDADVGLCVVNGQTIMWIHVSQADLPAASGLYQRQPVERQLQAQS